MTQSPPIPYGLRRASPPVAGACAVRTVNLSVKYPGATKVALHDVSIEVTAKKRVALLGSNGAGKSSLLKAIVGLLPVQSGSIELFGLGVRACRSRVAYLPQRGEIDWAFPVSVERLILTGRYCKMGWFRRASKSDLELVRATAEQLGLASLLDRQIGELSGGQQQRTLMARTLVQEADLLLLDEPLNAVDGQSRECIREIVHKLNHQGKTLVIATHEHGWRDEDFDEIIHLREGAVVGELPEGWAGWRPGKGMACPG